MILAAVLRVHLLYLWQHRRVLHLRRPRRFSEWVQHRKLFDRDPRLPLLTDKVAVKALVASALGVDWVIPTLWHGRVLPARPPAPLPLVIKARHGCGQIVFFRTPADWDAARAGQRLVADALRSLAGRMGLCWRDARPARRALSR